MGLSDTIEKLDKYNERLAKGKAEKIKPHHVERVIEKLTAKETELVAEMPGVTKAEKRERMEQKLARIREQIERATWLREQI